MQNDQTKLQLLIERLRMSVFPLLRTICWGYTFTDLLPWGAFPGLQEMWIAWL